MTELDQRPAIGVPRLIDVEDFFADPEFSGAEISPDGTKIAYLAPHHGRTNVWVRGIDEDHDDAVCVTDDRRRGIKTFYWTDDPRWLLYRQDTDGNEDWHIYRVDLGRPDAPAVDLTPLPPGSRVGSVELIKSDPSAVLVRMNRRPLVFDIFRIELATGDTTVHLEMADPSAAVLLTPDGDVAFHGVLTRDGYDEIYALDETGGRRLVYRSGGPEYPVGSYPVLVAPDGNGLLIGSYQDSDDLRLIRVDGDTGEQTVVAAIEGQSLSTSGVFSEDFGEAPTVFLRRNTGEVLAARFVGDRPTLQVLDARFASVYEALSKLSDGELFSVSSDLAERRWVATFIHDREPKLTYLYDHETGESRLLFRPFPYLDPTELAPMTPVSLAARDGLALHGFLTLPVGVEPQGLPLVLLVHGGPWYQDQWSYNREVQFLANRGYAVLQVNFRGSTGYGRKHLTAAIGELAGAMHDDLIDAANWAVEQGYADPKRIGIYGGSYGGYAALVGVTVTPDYFAAAVDYVGVSSLPSFIRAVPEFVRHALTNNWLAYAGDPDDPAQEADMLARSPITMVDRISTPLLVVQGAKDARVPQSESDNIVSSLRARGVPVEYIVAEDEGHDFSNPENLITMFRAIERHFAEHLGGRHTTKGPAA